jgi:O-antigen/teichoic acid export membrane protein
MKDFLRFYFRRRTNFEVLAFVATGLALGGTAWFMWLPIWWGGVALVLVDLTLHVWWWRIGRFRPPSSETVFGTEVSRLIKKVDGDDEERLP